MSGYATAHIYNLFVSNSFVNAAYVESKLCYLQNAMLHLEVQFYTFMLKAYIPTPSLNKGQRDNQHAKQQLVIHLLSVQWDKY
jgi:hypothetical protein